MAGRGPSPKDPARRARSNSDPIPMRILPAVLAAQPELPFFYVTTTWRDKETGQNITEREPYSWAPQTEVWWDMWASSPLASSFTSTDWSELLDTALIHSEVWNGDFKLASELRLRTAKFGATPEDRARLRIQFAEADEAETKVVERRVRSGRVRAVE